jgi:pimeloyl-ACP methyl ester carboxylesterase
VAEPARPPHDEAGAGPAVVLLHAGVADRSMWADLLPVLASAGYRAIAIDLPGFGEAPAAPGLAPHDAVIGAMDVLGVGRAVLVGSSFGGAVALRVAAVAPQRVAALMLISAPPPDLEPSEALQAAWEEEEGALERGDVEAAVDAVVRAWTLPGAPAELREHVAAMQRRIFELQLAAGEDEEPEDPLEARPEALDLIDVPAVVAAGERDMVDFQEGAERTGGRLPNARTVVIAGAGHLAPLEQPARFQELLLGFLREQAPQNA